MKKPALYSSANRARKAGPAASANPPPASDGPRAPAPPGSPAASGASASGAAPPRASFLKRHDRAVVFVVGGAVALGLVTARDAMRPAPPALTQEDIDDAVLYTMENKTLPSRAAKAADAVMNSVVRVRGYDAFDEPGGNDLMQVLGGAGYTSDFPLERHYRDVRHLAIAEGSNQIQALLLAQGELGLSALRG